MGPICYTMSMVHARSVPSAFPPDQAVADLLNALEKLNHIGAAVNQAGAGDRAGTQATLRLIVDSAVQMVAGASAVIYTYDEARGVFDPSSRVSAGELTDEAPSPDGAQAGPTGAPPEGVGAEESAPLPAGDEPRPDGLGMRAIHARRPMLSYEELDPGIHPAKVAAGAQSMAAFPLVVAGDCVGVLYVYLREARSFSQLEMLMLGNFVNQAATTVYHARQLAGVQRDLARKDDELTRLRKAGLLISSRLRLEETLEAILQMALDVTNARYGIFRLLDESGRYLVTRAIAGEHLGQPAIEPLPVDSTSVMGWVARHRQPLCIPDLQADPWARVYYPLDRDLTMRSELTVPLLGANGHLEGVLNLESPVAGAFGQQDSHLLQSLATQASIAIQQARLLDALQEIAGLLLVQPCQRVLDRLAELACELLNARSSAIWTVQGEQLAPRASANRHRPGDPLPLRRSLAGQAILERDAVMASDVRADPRFARLDLALAEGWVGALVVPVLSGEDAEPLGAFGVYSGQARDGSFGQSDWDKKVLSILARYAGLALHNARRQEALRQAQEQRAVAETFAALGDIAANLLHHLNNKVGTIPVRVQGIQDKYAAVLDANPYLASNLAEIECSAAEAMAAVRDSLSLLHPIQLVPVSLAACVSSALASASLPANIAVQSEGLESMPPVAAGQQSLVLVIINLLQNAAEAMDGQGTVIIRATAQGGRVLLAVSDNGPGIPPELQERIFEFNFSARKAAKRGKLGFGLWWVKTLMARLGGSIQVESDGKTGTTFRLSLPCAETRS